MVVFVSSAGTIAFTELIKLAVNVGNDVETGKANQGTILQILQSMKRDDG